MGGPPAVSTLSSAKMNRRPKPGARAPSGKSYTWTVPISSNFCEGPTSTSKLLLSLTGLVTLRTQVGCCKFSIVKGLSSPFSTTPTTQCFMKSPRCVSACKVRRDKKDCFIKKQKSQYYKLCTKKLRVIRNFLFFQSKNY